MKADQENFVQAVRDRVAEVVVGQDIVVERMMIALLTGGHLLLLGVPGVAKTLLVNSLAKAPETAAEVTPADEPAKSLSEELPGNQSAPVTVKPGETGNVDVVAPPAEPQPEGEKPAENKPAEDKPAGGEKPAEEKPAEGAAAEEKPAGEDKTPPQ